MHIFTQIVDQDNAKPVDLVIELELEQRVKSRIKALDNNNAEVGIILERGECVKHLDIVSTNDGVLAQIIAKKETLSSVYCDDKLLLLRACYHLGNRHIAVQITQNSLHYQHDHVLDEMLKNLGLDVVVESLEFFPENGAYGDGKHFSNHSHSH